MKPLKTSLIPLRKPKTRSRPNRWTTITDQMKTWAGTLQSILTIAALVVGGWWAWVRGGLSESVDVTQKISAVSLNDEFWLVHVDVSVENKGQRSAVINEVQLYAGQVLPLAGAPLERYENGAEPLNGYSKTGDWPLLKAVVHNDAIILMPGEKDLTSFQLCVEKRVQVINLYVSIPVKNRGPNQAWSSEKLFEIKSSSK